MLFEYLLPPVLSDLYPGGNWHVLYKQALISSSSSFTAQRTAIAQLPNFQVLVDSDAPAHNEKEESGIVQGVCNMYTPSPPRQPVALYATLLVRQRSLLYGQAVGR